jgi:hypothetical protein
MNKKIKRGVFLPEIISITRVKDNIVIFQLLKGDKTGNAV